MEEAKFRTRELFDLVDISKRIFQPNNYDVTTVRSLVAKRLAEKAILHSISFTRLWPAYGEDEFLDSSSLASIARNIIEIHNVFQYVCERGISEEEFDLRYNVMELHQYNDLIRVLTKLGFPDDDEIIVAHKLNSGFYSRRNIEENSIFKSLDLKKQKAILQTKEAYLKERIKNKINPLTQEVESGIYNLLSNSLHSFPLGVSNYNSYSDMYHLNSLNMMFLSMEVTIIYLASTLSLYIRLRPKISKLLTKDEKEYIKKMGNNSNVDYWIKYRIDYADKRRFFSYKQLED
ncbi:hypothetical protein [Paenibacillus hamazuiensis]|uniref:hypothetical protein n=1 Tax=Paenibacillus hamazuiensis TaxID=2936508 RepID=UPI00200BEA1A|nr:hypothetical protein [Paenibacillus hamazuiensis]